VESTNTLYILNQLSSKASISLSSKKFLPGPFSAKIEEVSKVVRLEIYPLKKVLLVFETNKISCKPKIKFAKTLKMLLY
jgi:hypothetical protein